MIRILALSAAILVGQTMQSFAQGTTPPAEETTPPPPNGTLMAGELGQPAAFAALGIAAVLVAIGGSSDTTTTSRTGD